MLRPARFRVGMPPSAIACMADVAPPTSEALAHHRIDVFGARDSFSTSHTHSRTSATEAIPDEARQIPANDDREPPSASSVG